MAAKGTVAVDQQRVVKFADDALGSEEDGGEQQQASPDADSSPAPTAAGNLIKRAPPPPSSPGLHKKSNNLILQAPAFSFVEEGKNVRAGRKNNANYWTVITVNGKEFVVEKQFKRPDPPVLSENSNRKHRLLSSLREGLGNTRKEFNPLRPSVGRVRCDLCLLFYSKDSVNGVISFKRILDLRRKWGLELRGRRSTSASYLYTEAKLCLFCSQLFQVSENETSDNSKQKAPVMSTEHIEFRPASHNHMNAPPSARLPMTPSRKVPASSSSSLSSQSSVVVYSPKQVAPRAGTPTALPLDLALNKKVVMSSIADGYSGSLAVNGTWQVKENDSMCARTFVEFEPWWEVDLEALHHISVIKILQRSRPRGQPLVDRMTPFWVMLSKGPILASDIMDAKESCLYCIKVTKDEPIITVEVPKDISARFVRLQTTGIKSLQVAAVQVYRAESSTGQPYGGKSPKLWPGDDTFRPVKAPSPRESRGGRQGGQLANFQPQGRPQTTVGGAISDSVSNKRKSVQWQGIESSIPRPFTMGDGIGVGRRRPRSEDLSEERFTFKAFSSSMAQAGVKTLLSQTIKRYKEKEEWNARLQQAKSLFTEAELQSLTDLFIQLACDNGYPRQTPIEVIKVTTSSLMTTLFTVRGRSLSLKEFVGDSSALEAINNVTENLSRVCKPKHSKDFSLPTDYCQYLGIMDCLREGRVSMEDVKKVFASYIKKIMREADTTERRAMERSQKKAAAAAAAAAAAEAAGGEGRTLLDKEQNRTFRNMEQLLKHKKIFFTRFREKMTHEIQDWGLKWFDWAREHERRREHQEQLRLAAPPPDITPRLPHKICAVCLYHFPGDALCESVTIKSLANLFAKLNLPPDKYTTRLEFGMNKFYRIPICVFCNQFFDPDEDDGLARKRNILPLVGYIPFFDDRHPERYSMADPEVKKKYTASAMAKEGSALLPLTTTNKL